MKIYISHDSSFEEVAYVKEVFQKFLSATEIVTESSQYNVLKYNDKCLAEKMKEDYLFDYDLIVVLLSKNYWRKKHCDWEVSGALCQTSKYPPQPILTIVCKNYVESYGEVIINRADIVPLRLLRNINNHYSPVLFWSDLKVIYKPSDKDSFNGFVLLEKSKIDQKIDQAFCNSWNQKPINSDPVRRRDNCRY